MAEPGVEFVWGSLNRDTELAFLRYSSTFGGGRHLVAAKNPERWYANPDPDPETLLKARADFGKMILTPETIAANPFPSY